MTDLDREAARIAEAESQLNMAWMWHVPRTRVESAVVGAAVSWLLPALWATVALEAWPWWQRLVVAVVVAPWLLIAVAMAVRAPWCRGVTRRSVAAAMVPAVLWLAVVIAGHASSLGVIVDRVVVPAVYIAVSVATVVLWRRWTHSTWHARRAARWSAEGDDGPPIGL